MVRTREDSLRSTNLRLLDSQEHADVKFLIGREKIVMKAHKLILASRSDGFKHIFSSARGRSKKNHVNEPIEIPGTNVENFRSFLKFIYADELDPAINFSEMMNILVLADIFDVQPLLSRCDRILISKFDLWTHSPMEWYCVARRCARNVIMSNIEDKIASNFDEFSKVDQFLVIDEDLLTKLLSRDDLNIEEIDLFEAIVRWGNDQLQDEENQQRPLSSILENLLPLIRFPLITLTKFAFVVRPTKLLPDADMVDIYTYLAASKDQRNQLRGTLKHSATPRTGGNGGSLSSEAPSG